jgi:hypothetical protein
MLDFSDPGDSIVESADYAIAFRKAAHFDSITNDAGRRVARAFGRNSCRFTCTIKATYLGCQRVRLAISTNIKGFCGPSEEFEGTTDDVFEMLDGPIIGIGKITPDAVMIGILPAPS